MAIARLARLGRQAKRPFGLCVKMTAVAILGLCFIFVWSMFSSPANSVTNQRESFDDISEPTSATTKVSDSRTQSIEKNSKKHEISKEEDKKVNLESDLDKKVNGTDSSAVHRHESRKKNNRNLVSNVNKEKDSV